MVPWLKHPATLIPVSACSLLRRIGQRRTGAIRLSLRLATDQARAITLAAKAAVLPTGDCVAGPVAGVPALSAGANRTDHLAAFARNRRRGATGIDGRDGTG